MQYLESNLKKFYERYPQESELFSSVNFLGIQKKVLSSYPSIPIDEKFEGSHMVIFLGIGDGVFFKKIYSALKSQSFLFVIFERSLEVVAKLWSNEDWTETIDNKKTFWFLGEKSHSSNFEEAFNHMGLINSLGSYNVVKMPEQASESPNYDKVLEGFIKFGFDKMQNLAAQPEDTYRGLVSYVRNTSRIASIPRLEKFKGIYQGKPAIIAMAGPSLKYCLPLLKKIQNHAVIICADAVYKLLLAQDIIPHFVASMERTCTYQFFENTSEKSSTCLIASPVLQPESLDAFSGPKLFLPSFSHGHEFFYPEEKGNDIGRTCATQAYVALNLLGCDKIYLMGQDLAFDRFSENSHVEGVWEEVREDGKYLYKKLKNEKSNGDKNWIEGNNGEPILSNCFWISFRNDFIKFHQRYGCKTFNVIPKNYGAKIHGFEQIEPDDFFNYFDLTQEVPRIDFASKAKIPAEEIQKKEESLKQAFEKAVSIFDTVVTPSILEMNDALSLFYQYNLTMIDTEGLEEKYKKMFNELETYENNLLQSHLFEIMGLLLPFVQYTIPEMCIKISTIKSEPIRYCEKAAKIVQTLFDHYKELLYWSSRVSDLLKKRLNGKI